MRTRLAALGLYCVLATGQGEAQTRMIVLQSESANGPAQLLEVDVESARLIRTFDLPFDHTAGSLSTPAAVTADGQYVAWLGNTYPTRTLSVLDRSTGWASPIASLRPSAAPLSETYPHTLLAHPTAVR